MPGELSVGATIVYLQAITFQHFTWLKTQLQSFN